MRQQQVLIVGFMLVFGVAGVLVQAGTAEDEAVEVAESWLELVDSGEYAESWNEAAELFRKALPQEQWAEAAAAVREPLGEIRSRELESAEYATSLPGAPDGEYVVIRFETSFARKETAVETVTPMKDPDGVWRVSGYFIK